MLPIENHANLFDLKPKFDEYDEYDENLCEYYKTAKVKFSNGDAVDFDNADESITSKKLATRIYKTGNSIVHSKESEQSKYMPFRDGKMLVKEIPLLRFIAEQTIIDSSNIAG